MLAEIELLMCNKVSALEGVQEKLISEASMEAETFPLSLTLSAF